MTHDLSKHPCFRPWSDPDTGIVSYILNERVAPVQQHFYFTNASLSSEERWLWFHAAFPPSPHRCLAVMSMDPSDRFMKVFPGTAGCGATPCVTAEGDACYLCLGPAVYRQPIDGDAEEVCRLPDEYIAHRQLHRLATHLTVSADGRYLLLDGHVGNHWFVALGEIATGKVQVLAEFGCHYNHGAFSTVDPNLFLLAQDWSYDPISGRLLMYHQRIWLMDVPQSRFEPLVPDQWYQHGKKPSHEWWSADGLVCWIDYDEGAFECDVDRRELVHVWPGPLCHGHCDATRQYWCADESPYKWNRRPCEIRFFDRKAQKQIDIVSAMPQPPIPRHPYHVDPHPQFSPRGTFVVYTTAVEGRVDVALAPVQGILDKLAGR